MGSLLKSAYGTSEAQPSSPPLLNTDCTPTIHCPGTSGTKQPNKVKFFFFKNQLLLFIFSGKIFVCSLFQNTMQWYLRVSEVAV